MFLSLAGWWGGSGSLVGHADVVDWLMLGAWMINIYRRAKSYVQVHIHVHCTLHIIYNYIDNYINVQSCRFIKQCTIWVRNETAHKTNMHYK